MSTPTTTSSAPPAAPALELPSAKLAPTREGFTTGPDGTRLYVRRRGEGPVSAVFCDGILCDGFIWKYLWDEVAERMPVAHFHYRGHGRSAAPLDPEAVGMDTLARDTDAVRRYLGDPGVVLFGHSMGCQVAIEACRVRPDKVRGLVLLCGSFGRVTETFKGTRILADLLPRVIEAVSPREGLARALWSRLPSELAVKFTLLAREVDPKHIRPEDMLPYMQHLSHVDLPMFLRMLRGAGEHDAEEFLPHIKCPVLIVAGERDSFTPAYLSEQMAKKIPGAELLFVPGGTHVTPLEQRDLVHLRIDKFLRDRVLSR